MKETDCRKCCVSDFKHALCKEDFCEKYYREGSAEDFEKLLPHWIPCSERLPEPEGCKQYLVTEAHYDPKFKGRHVTVDEYEARDPENPPYWVNHREDDGIRVVAWQPMPEPWKGNE